MEDSYVFEIDDEVEVDIEVILWMHPAYSVDNYANAISDT